MAIYSFNHDSFGKTTNRVGAAGDNAAYNARVNETRLDRAIQDGTAAGNAAYNAREEATYAVRSHVIPPGPKEAEAWFRQQEQGERKNARMSDRFIGALPRELTPEQCIEAVETFCREVTQDRVPWHFALHLELDKKNEPDWNPHVHIIFRDRDIETGRRSLYTSAGPKERTQLDAKGIDYWTTKDFREKWSADMNHALERAGHDARIDHRSLKEQGIDRDAQIHIGPGSQNAAKKGHEFQSADMELAGRTIPYSLLDQGSRADHNGRIVEGNRQHRGDQQPVASREHPDQARLREAQGEIRRGMYGDQKADRDVLREAQKAQLDQHQAWAKKLYADARQAAFDQVKEQTAERWEAVRGIENKAQGENAEQVLKLEQKNLYAKTSALHIGQARIEKDQVWQGLRQSQLQERTDLRAAHRDEYAALSRQQAAERLSVAEQYRAQQLQRDAGRVAAKFSKGQGMAQQQQAALQEIKLNKQAGRDGSSPGPDKSAIGLMKTAFAEDQKRSTIREHLNGLRHANHARAATPDRIRPGQGRGAGAVERNAALDAQSQLRQAAQSGRTLSSDERANAPEDVRGTLDRQDRQAAQRVTFERTPSGNQTGKGWSGGGRGR
jgi:hypothetical protein